MLSDFLNIHGIKSAANFVEYGYGQVEPNHLSAQRTGQIYAQLPADPAIMKLEQGQFVKYDYATGLVNFTGVGEWMLVYNEIKLYRDHQADCEFAMLKDNYKARVYSPFGGATSGEPDTVWQKQSRYYNGVDNEGNTSITLTPMPAAYKQTADTAPVDGKTYYTLQDEEYVAVDAPSADEIANYFELDEKVYAFDKVTTPKDHYEIYATEDPFHIESRYQVAKMPIGTTMVPRVFKTNVGDIFTTNTVRIEGTGEDGIVLPADRALIVPGTILIPDPTDGILTVGDAGTGMAWQVVKNYTMPDHQAGLKIMRVQ